MKELPLTQGQVAMVEDEDYEKFSSWKWHSFWNHHTKSFYARRSIRTGRRSVITVWLHREILGLDVRDKRRGDHINRNTLDNRRENLRICSAAENNWNRRICSINKSGVKGVDFHKASKKWQARITVRGNRISLGYFDSVAEAQVVIEDARKRLHGEFARMT